MTGLPFFKYQSVGNDFVLFDAESVLDLDLGALAIEACERRFGIGADGMLVLDKLTPNYLELRMFNADGTPDFCGNGLRCSVAHAVEHMGADRTLRVEHLGRLVEATYADGMITTTLPGASYDSAHIPTLFEHEIFQKSLSFGEREVTASALTTGSAHLVVDVAKLPEDEVFFETSPQIETDERFPERISVMWTQREDDTSIRLRIWERGVGETLGCGTGSVAAAVNLMRQTGSKGPIQVHNPGGTLVVTAEDWREGVSVSGTAKLAFQGKLQTRQAPVPTEAPFLI